MNYNGGLPLSIPYMLTFILLLVCTGFSPALGLTLSLLLLIFDFSGVAVIRYVLSFFAIFNYTFIAASKYYASGSFKDDFSNIYYPAFLDVFNGGTIFRHDFSQGIEFFLTGYFKLLQMSFGFMSQPQVLVAVVGLVLFLYYVWIEKFLIPTVDSNKKSLCVASVLVFFTFMLATHYMRQIFGSVFILYSVSYFNEKKRLKSLIFLVVAVISHSSSLLIMPIYCILLSDKLYLKKSLVFLSLIFSLGFAVIIKIAISINLLGPATYKLLFYSDGTAGGSSLFYSRFLIVFCISGWFLFSDKEKKWKELLFYGTASYLILSLIPVLPNRIYNVLGCFYLGYLGYLSFYKAINYYRLILMLYVFYRFYVIAFQLDYLNSTSIEDSFQSLWYPYAWGGDNMFYYFKIF